MLTEHKSARHARWAIPLAVIGGMVAIFSASAAYFIYSGDSGSGQAALPTRTITVGGVSLAAEVAETPEEKRQGLSNRRALASGEGMLFPVYPPDRPGFWMKEMNFPLDFIYLFEGKVVEIKEDIPPSSFPRSFFPSMQVDAVLEVNAGWAAERGIRVGDQASY